MNQLHIDSTLIDELHHVGTRHYARLFAFVFLYAAAGYGAFWLVKCYPADGLAPSRLPSAPVPTGRRVAARYQLVHARGRPRTVIPQSSLEPSAEHRLRLPVLQNFSAYRVLHLNHHRHLGLPGDPDHYPNYTRWSWLVFAMNWGRLLLGYPAYITAIPLLGFRQGNISDRWWIVFEVGLLVLLAGVVLVSPLPGRC